MVAIIHCVCCFPPLNALMALVRVDSAGMEQVLHVMQVVAPFLSVVLEGVHLPALPGREMPLADRQQALSRLALVFCPRGDDAVL